jgi:hypothetical protein
LSRSELFAGDLLQEIGGGYLGLKTYLLKQDGLEYGIVDPLTFVGTPKSRCAFTDMGEMGVPCHVQNDIEAIGYEGKARYRIG